MAVEVFAPIGATVTIGASTTTANGNLPAAYKDVVLYVVNPTNGVAFIAWGHGATTATTAGVPVPANGGSVKIKAQATGGSDVNNVGVILATGATAGNVYVTPGEGGV